MPILALAGALVTLSIFILTIVFRIGHHTARLESLEEWRTNVRGDLHEVSEQMTTMNNTLSSISTLIEERTEKQLPLHRR